MKSLRTALFVVVLLVLSSMTTAAPYYDWIDGYDGTESNTIGLWDFDNYVDNATGMDYDPEVTSGSYPRAFNYGNSAYVSGGGKFGSAVQLPGGQGSADYIGLYTPPGDSPSPFDLFPAGADPSLSVEAWVKFDDTTQATQWIFDKMFSGNNGYQLFYYGGSKNFYFKVGDGTNTVQAIANVSGIANNEWYHIAGTWDAATDTVALYVNGVKLGSATSAGMVIQDSSVYALRIGNRLGSSYGVFAGAIDNPRISSVAYEYAIPPYDGSPYSDWREPYDGSSPHTLGLWHFDDTYMIYSDDWLVTDENSIHGATHRARIHDWVGGSGGGVNNADFTTPAKFGTGAARNKGGNSGNDYVYVDGSHLTTALWPSGPDPSITVEFWAQENDPNQGGWIWLIDRKYSTPGVGYQFYLSVSTTPESRKLNFKMGDGGSGDMLLIADLPWKTHTWYHIAGTWNSDTDTLSLYRDGKLLAENTFAGKSIKAHTGGMRFTQRLGSGYGTLNGGIDEVRISDVAYNFTRHVGEPYAGGPYYDWVDEYDGSAPNTIALWNFNEDDIFYNSAIKYLINNDTISEAAHRARIVNPASYGGSDQMDFGDGGKFGWGVIGPGDAYSDNVYVDASHIRGWLATEADSSFSAECWVSLNDLSEGSHQLIDKRYNNPYGFELMLQKGTVSAADEYNLFFNLGDGTVNLPVYAELQWETDRFYHIAGTWNADDNMARLYRDGELVASSISSGFVWDDGVAGMRIGNRLGSLYRTIDGVIDGVRISDAAYEYASMPVCSGSLAGDISGAEGIPDCDVEMYDLDALVQVWLDDTTPVGGGLPGDVSSFFTPAADNAAGYAVDEVYPDGQLFPMGLFSVTNPDLTKVKDMGFTMVGPYYGEIGSGLGLAEAEALGVKYVARVGMGITASEFDEPGFVMPTDLEIQSTITTQVTALASNDAIAWWYVASEELRHWRVDEMHLLDVATAAIRAADPLGRPVWMYEPNNRDAAALGNTLIYQDICGKGMYTNYAGKQNKRVWVRQSTEQEVAAVAAANTAAIPIAVPEMFADPNVAADDDLVDDWARHDLYLSLVSGAKGCMIFSGARRVGFERTYDAYLSAYGSVANELNGELNLGNALLFGEERSDLSVAITSGPTTLTLTSPAYVAPSVAFLDVADMTGRYLIMVNSANSAVGVTVSGLPSSAIISRDVFNSDAYTTISGGSFADTLGALEVKCYRFAPEPQACGDEGGTYLEADISGPAGVPDCNIDLYDFAIIGGNWLNCIVIDDPLCNL